MSCRCRGRVSIRKFEIFPGLSSRRRPGSIPAMDTGLRRYDKGEGDAPDPRISGLEPLRQPGEDRTARAELRRADTDPGAIADLILQIEQIDDVEPQFEPLE